MKAGVAKCGRIFFGTKMQVNAKTVDAFTLERMHPREPIKLSIAPTRQLTRFVFWAMSAIAVAAWLFVLILCVTSSQPPGWLMAVLLISATTATLLALAKQLPGENVILAAFIIAFVGGSAHGLGAITSIPFGPFDYLDAAGPKFFGTLSWSAPFLWVFIVLNSRGVARLILRPWRKLRSYGFWLIGLTASLTVLFDVALEPFASRINHYWLWNPTRLPLNWQGAPLINFLGWLMTSLLILAFATPCLINKNPHPKQSTPDYHPLATWLAAVLLFGASAATKNHWLAAAYCLIIAGFTAFYAIRGARW